METSNAFFHKLRNNEIMDMKECTVMFTTNFLFFMSINNTKKHQKTLNTRQNY